MGNLTSDVAAFGPSATGGIFAGPSGTALPTDASTALDAALKALGKVDDGGLQPAGDAASVNDLKDWAGDIVASVAESKSITRFNFGLIGMYDDEVAKFVFGSANVTVVAATTSTPKTIAIQDKGDDIAARVFVFEMLYAGKLARFVVPNGKPVVTGEKAYTKTGLAGYDVQLTCLPDASGVRVYRYLKDDVLAPA
jgi:hypothetical protein